MARCVRDEFEAEAIPPGNYCWTHRPKNRVIFRLDESVSEFSESDEESSYDNRDSHGHETDDEKGE